MGKGGWEGSWGGHMVISRARCGTAMALGDFCEDGEVNSQSQFRF